MTADERDARAGQNLQHLRAEKPELAVAHDCDARAAFNMHALGYAARGGERLCEDRALVRHFVGHGQEISCGQLKRFCERAVAPDDAEHRARGAVARVARETRGTFAAARVYLADDS